MPCAVQVVLPDVVVVDPHGDRSAAGLFRAIPGSIGSYSAAAADGIIKACVALMKRVLLALHDDFLVVAHQFQRPLFSGDLENSQGC